MIVDDKFYRPAEVDLLIGDATKGRTKLGWEPVVTFEALIKMMVDADLAALQEEGVKVPMLKMDHKAQAAGGSGRS